MTNLLQFCEVQKPKCSRENQVWYIQIYAELS